MSILKEIIGKKFFILIGIKKKNTMHNNETQN